MRVRWKILEGTVDIKLGFFALSQPSLNPGGRQASDVVLLNHWSIRNYDVQRGDIVSLV